MIDHWKNDFIISGVELTHIKEKMVFCRNNLYCYTGMEYYAQRGNTSIIILGRIFDIQEVSLTEGNIADNILKYDSRSLIESYLRRLSGRFIIILLDKSGTRIYPDACATLSLYFGNIQGNPVAGFSILLLNNMAGKDPQISKEISEFLDSEVFRNNGCYWIGDQSEDAKYRLLLANHYLNFDKNKIVRRNFHFDFADYSYAQKVDQFSQWMVNALNVVKERKLMIPVTAGIDSRIIYAAAKNLELNATYYLFDTGFNEVDLKIGQQITSIGNDALEIYPESIPDKNFVQDFSSLFYFVTEEDRISHYSHHQKNDPGKMNVNGNGGDIFRGYYSYYNMVSAEKVLQYTGYSNISFFVKDLQEWLDNLQVTKDIQSSDLLYWEQKTSNWFGRYQYEKNFFIDDYSPYNNYNLILLGFSVPFKKRRAYKNSFQLDVISSLFPSIKDISVNPEQKLLHKIKMKTYQSYWFWKFFNRMRKA